MKLGRLKICDPTSEEVMVSEAAALDLAATASTEATSQVPGVSMVHNVSVKDGIVIGFMLGLWLYSIYLMFRYNTFDKSL
jgi:hypothetical protein